MILFLFQEGKKTEEKSQIISLAMTMMKEAEEELRSCSVSVGHFWYVNQIYGEKMKCIEKDNGVEIKSEVTVNFKPKHPYADLKKARSEFTNLVQNSITESNGFVVPFKTMAPEDCSTILNIIQKYENKLFLTISSQEVTVCGPKHSQDSVKECLHRNKIATINTTPSAASTDKQLTIGMKINDPLVKTGLSMDLNRWCYMRNSFMEQLNEIKTKFNVDLIETNTIGGNVDIMALHRSDGNVAMESHAQRALLRLYQKFVTSHMRSKQSHDIGGVNIWMQQSYEHQSEGAVGGLELSGMQGPSHDICKLSTKESKNDEGDNCPICLDKFTNKKQLNCKHEFCDGCLQRSMDSNGPICPLCKDVYGIVVGNQPVGKMTSNKTSSSLPGFPGCGTITINYNIPSGTQTVNVLIWTFIDTGFIVLFSYILISLNLCRQNIQTQDSSTMVLVGQHICQTTLTVMKC